MRTLPYTADHRPYTACPTPPLTCGPAGLETPEDTISMLPALNVCTWGPVCLLAPLLPPPLHMRGAPPPTGWSSSGSVGRGWMSWTQHLREVRPHIKSGPPPLCALVTTGVPRQSDPALGVQPQGGQHLGDRSHTQKLPRGHKITAVPVRLILHRNNLRLFRKEFNN